jgi:hypothetical protein
MTFTVFPLYAGPSRKMTDWLSKLEQLDIPDGAVAGLSNADKPVLEGKLLQLSAGDRPLFFRGQQIHILKRLRTLLPDTPAGQALHTASQRPHSSAY